MGIEPYRIKTIVDECKNELYFLGAYLSADGSIFQKNSDVSYGKIHNQLKRTNRFGWDSWKKRHKQKNLDEFLIGV